MASIKGKDTRPELTVRRFLHSKGIGYRLHRKELPGKPDIVMKNRRTVIFVNGCFWHRHQGCKFSYNPKSNSEFWQRKFQNNVARDENNYKSLKKLGWKVIIIWECEVKNDTFQKKLLEQLEGKHGT